MARVGNIHPGEVLQEDFLVPLEMSPYALAKALGVSPTAVGEILKGKRSITPATALRLQRFFGAEAEFWLNLQAMYDLEEQRGRLAEELEAIQPCERVAA
jgi:addiction module HigA family antidote